MADHAGKVANAARRLAVAATSPHTPERFKTEAEETLARALRRFAADFVPSPNRLRNYLRDILFPAAPAVAQEESGREREPGPSADEYAAELMRVVRLGNGMLARGLSRPLLSSYLLSGWQDRQPVRAHDAALRADAELRSASFQRVMAPEPAAPPAEEPPREPPCLSCTPLTCECLSNNGPSAAEEAPEGGEPHVYCHACSDAGGGEVPAYHAPPVCYASAPPPPAPEPAAPASEGPGERPTPPYFWVHEECGMHGVRAWTGQEVADYAHPDAAAVLARDLNRLFGKTLASDDLFKRLWSLAQDMFGMFGIRGDDPEAAAQVVQRVGDLIETARQREGEPRIKTPCPACGTETLFIGEANLLTCSWHDCPDPIRADAALRRLPPEREGEPLAPPEGEQPFRVVTDRESGLGRILGCNGEWVDAHETPHVAERKATVLNRVVFAWAARSAPAAPAPAAPDEKVDAERDWLAGRTAWWPDTLALPGSVAGVRRGCPSSPMPPLAQERIQKLYDAGEPYVEHVSPGVHRYRIGFVGDYFGGEAPAPAAEGAEPVGRLERFATEYSGGISVPLAKVPWAHGYSLPARPSPRRPGAAGGGAALCQGDSGLRRLVRRPGGDSSPR